MNLVPQSLTRIGAMPSTVERRQTAVLARARRAAWGWIMATDLRTLEKIWITLQVALACAVLVIQFRLGASVGDRPLTLPAWAWASLLILGMFWQAYGGAVGSKPMRLHGAAASFVICCLLFGPLWRQGQGLALALIPFTLWQATAIYRFYHAVQREEQECVG